MTISLVVAGHSHATALGVPVLDAGAAPTIVDIPAGQANIRALGGELPRGDAYWAALAAATADASPVILWEGGQHQARFLIEPRPPIDFVLSLAPSLPMDPRASFVAEAQLRALFAPSIRPLGALVRRLENQARPVLVAGTPPPAANEAAVRERLMADPAVVADLADREIDIATSRLTASFVLQKLWSLVQAMVAETTATAGGIFVPVPDRVRNADGFLAGRFLADDGLHANADYGQEMINEIVAVATSGKPIA